jgi:uncharacterized protein (DUF1684 family)
MDTSIPGFVTLADWRRRVAELYANVRAEPDPERAWHRWRDARRDLFLHHPRSPIPAAQRASYEGPFLYDYDPVARTLADLDDTPLEPLEIGNSDGTTTRFTRFARASFELYGRPGALDVFWLEAYAGGIYLSLRDATSGATTYGGGRYLLDTAKGADLGEEDGRVVLDFNFAYQPSCSYDPAWSCPLPPPANRIPFAVPAGERVRP